MRLISISDAAFERLVLVSGQGSARKAEAPPQPQIHRICGAGAVERRGNPGPPIDDHRVRVLVLHMAASDIEPLDIVPGRDIDAAEKQRRRRIVNERESPSVQRGGKVLARDSVAADRLQRVSVLAHAAKCRARRLQMLSLPIELSPRHHVLVLTG
jgi:hypothetical protein